MATTEPLKPCPYKAFDEIQNHDLTPVVSRRFGMGWARISCKCGFSSPEVMDANEKYAKAKAIKVHNSLAGPAPSKHDTDSGPCACGAWHSPAETLTRPGPAPVEGEARTDRLIDQMPEFLRHAEVRDLEALVIHCWIHSGYRDCGRDQMTEAERILYDSIVARSEEITNRDSVPVPSRPEVEGETPETDELEASYCTLMPLKARRLDDPQARATLSEIEFVKLLGWARHLEKERNAARAAQPREWDAETIKDAPEGKFYCSDDDGATWETYCVDQHFGGEYDTGLFVTYEKADCLRGAETAARREHIRYFGPIPTPSNTEKKA